MTYKLYPDQFTDGKLYARIFVDFFGTSEEIREYARELNDCIPDKWKGTLRLEIQPMMIPVHMVLDNDDSV